MLWAAQVRCWPLRAGPHGRWPADSRDCGAVPAQLELCMASTAYRCPPMQLTQDWAGWACPCPIPEEQCLRLLSLRHGQHIGCWLCPACEANSLSQKTPPFKPRQQQRPCFATGCCDWSACVCSCWSASVAHTHICTKACLDSAVRLTAQPTPLTKRRRQSRACAAQRLCRWPP